MTFALVAHAVAQTSDTKNVSTGSIDTSGAKLLVAITADSGGGFAVTDNKSNTWNQFTAYTISGITIRINVALNNVSVGSGHTFSHNSGSAFFPAIAVLAFSATGEVIWQQGTGTTQSGATNASATSIQPGSITPIRDNALLVQGLADSFGTSLAIDVGTLLDHMALAPGVAFGIASAYEIQTTAAARNPTWSWTTAGRIETDQAVFLEFISSSPTTFDPESAYTTGNFTLSNGNLTFHSTSTATDNGAYSSTFKTSGKHYLECSHTGVGNNNSRIGLSGPLGVQQIADMWRNIGDHGLSGMPDCLAIDLDNMKAWGRIGSGNWNGSGSANPSTNTGGVAITAAIAGGCWFYVDSAQDSGGPTWTVNFGGSPFAQTIPSGFTAWDPAQGVGSIAGTSTVTGLVSASASSVGSAVGTSTVLGDGSSTVASGGHLQSTVTIIT